MIQVYKDHNNSCVLATRRDDKRTTAITVDKGSMTRTLRVFSNRDFDKRFRVINYSPISAINVWIDSTIPMTSAVRREIQMVVAIFRNKVVAKADSLEELGEVNAKAVIVDGMESLEGKTMKELVKLYNATTTEKVKSVPGAEGDINVAAQTVLDALDNAPVVEKKTKPKKEGGRKNSRIPKDGIISLVVAENPKRAGTKGHAAFSCYSDGMTVAEFCEAGGSMADVRWDLAHNFIEVSGVSTEE